MTSTASERLAVSLDNLLKKIDDHCCTLSKTQQLFGLCTITPKSPYIQAPTKEIRAELENRARKHFKTKQLGGIYLRYFPPPLMPVPEEENPSKSISLDDYQLTFQVPQFDQKWKQTVIARNLIYCPLDPELYEYLDWFELQEEAIRLVPIVHQTVKELEIMANIERTLRSPAMPFFEIFIYKYGPGDSNFPSMLKPEKEKWLAKKIDWKDRYAIVLPIIKSAKTVRQLYAVARQKAAASRNPVLKALFWSFVEYIENLIAQPTTSIN